jgi:hypothetical protein
MMKLAIENKIYEINVRGTRSRYYQFRWESSMRVLFASGCVSKGWNPTKGLSCADLSKDPEYTGHLIQEVGLTLVREVMQYQKRSMGKAGSVG